MIKVSGFMQKELVWFDPSTIFSEADVEGEVAGNFTIPDLYEGIRKINLLPLVEEGLAYFRVEVVWDSDPHHPLEDAVVESYSALHYTGRANKAEIGVYKTTVSAIVDYEGKLPDWKFVHEIRGESVTSTPPEEGVVPGILKTVPLLERKKQPWWRSLWMNASN